MRGFFFTRKLSTLLTFSKGISKKKGGGFVDSGPEHLGQQQVIYFNRMSGMKGVGFRTAEGGT